MNTIEAFSCAVPLEELESAEELAFNMLHMDREKVMDQFDDIYEDTLEACLDTLECKVMFKGFGIERIDSDAIYLENGTVLESAVLADVLHRADEIVVYATVVHGFEELANNPANDMFESMFYNAWGVGYSMSSHAWVKRAIALRAHEAGRFTGRGWTPGEEDLELSLQGKLFECLDPSAIGMKLLDTGMMSPIMSISGFMGVSNDPAIEQDGAGKLESH